MTRPIDAEDLLCNFRCSDVENTAYFLRSALAQHHADLARAFVLDRGGERSQGIPPVLGYYTLTAGALEPRSRNAAVNRQRQPPPIIVMDHFAIHEAVEGTGIAGHLLLDAFSRILTATEHVAAIALVVHVTGRRAQRFAEARGFIRTGADDASLPADYVLPMRAIRKAVRRAFDPSDP